MGDISRWRRWTNWWKQEKKRKRNADLKQLRRNNFESDWWVVAIPQWQTGKQEHLGTKAKLAPAFQTRWIKTRKTAAGVSLRLCESQSSIYLFASTPPHTWYIGPSLSQVCRFDRQVILIILCIISSLHSFVFFKKKQTNHSQYTSAARPQEGAVCFTNNSQVFVVKVDIK